MSTNGAYVDGDVVMENYCIKDSESRINATPPGDGKNVSMVETPTMAKSASGMGTDAVANNHVPIILPWIVFVMKRP